MNNQKLIQELESYRKKSEKDFKKWMEGVQRNPLVQLEYVGDGIFDQQMIKYTSIGIEQINMGKGELFKTFLHDQILHNSRYPSSSTNQTVNLKHIKETSVLVEILLVFDKFIK